MANAHFITTQEQLDMAFHIRKVVFVEEQQVPSEEEYDEFEATSRHFLAFCDGVACGTSRWRFTEKGVKLERFAVLKEYRGKQVGSALMEAMLGDIHQTEAAQNQLRYLHAQITAMPLYAKFGFQPVGPMFEECNIQHYKMQLTSNA